jgi:predicted N-acetyltransferase YhbS
MPAHVRLRAARPGDLPAILEMTCQAFGEGARERFYNQLYHDSSHRLEQSRVAEVDGAIASYVRISDRPIRYGRATLRMGGIGAVATHPRFRGRGLATALLEDAIGYLRSAGYHLSMLFSGIQPFYSRLGWAPFPEHAFRLPVATAGRSPCPSGYTVRRFDPARDLAAVEHVYDAYNEGRTGPYRRHHRYWLDGHSRVLGVLPARVAERDGEVVAYASFRAAGETFWLYEAGCLTGAADAFLPLAWAVVNEARTEGMSTIEGQMPRSHGMLAALQAFAESPIEGRLPQHMMLRVVDLEGLFRSAAPALIERLRQRLEMASGCRAIGFRVAGEEVRLTVDREVLAVDAGPAPHVLDLRADLFFRLLLGERPLPLLTEEFAIGGVTLNEDDLRLLGVLFPPQDPFYWRADHF